MLPNETMNDAGTSHAIDARKGRAVMQQGVNQSSHVMTMARVYHHAGRFIDNNQVFVFKQNVKRNILGDKLQWSALRNVNGVTFA